MRSSWYFPAAALALALALGSAVAAHPHAPETRLHPMERQLQVAMTIDRLLKLGRAEQDAQALVEAARLSRRYEVSLLSAESEVAHPVELSRQWLEEAESMAARGGQVRLQRMIREAMAEADKGITPFAIVRILDLGPRGQARLRARAEGGEPTIIGASSDGTLQIALDVRGAGESAPRCTSSGELTLVCRLEIAREEYLTISLANRSRYSGTAYVISN